MFCPLPLVASASSAVFLLLARLWPLLRDSFRLAVSAFHDFPGFLNLLFEGDALGLLLVGGALNVSAPLPHQRPRAKQGWCDEDGIEPLPVAGRLAPLQVDRGHRHTGWGRHVSRA